MKILRAVELGMCFGVRDAITLAQRHAAAGPITILGELVHNESVLADLRRRGVLIRQDPADAPTREVMITAHGASQLRLDEIRALGLNVIEATCPLVHRAHQALAGLVQNGFHPVVIGQRGHVEVRGLTEDHPGCDIILTASDLDTVRVRPRFGVVSQTTQPVARVRDLVAALRTRFPDSEVRWIDTVCRPTKDRQAAAEDVALKSDVVVVIGGAHSNNTRELASTCRRYCARVHQIQTAAELSAEWFRADDTVGLTAGTSTPDELIEAVHSALARLQPAEALLSTIL